MQDYYSWAGLVGSVLMVIALGLLVWSDTEIPERQHRFTVPGAICAGVGLCLLGGMGAALAWSPRPKIVGQVTGFHDRHRSSVFEFRVDSNGLVGDWLSLNYFDKGFFFGDPILANGETVQVSYIAFSHEITAMHVISGRHTGWKYREDGNQAGFWVSGALGAILLAAIARRLRRKTRRRGFSG